MKAIAAGFIAATLATSVIAEGHAPSAIEVTPYIVAERALEAEENAFNFGADVDLTEQFSVSAEVATVDVDSEARFEFDSASLDFGFAATEKVSLYLKNDFDRDWARTETTVGVKVTF